MLSFFLLALWESAADVKQSKSEFIYFQIQLCGPGGLQLCSSLTNNTEAVLNLAYCMTFLIDPAVNYFTLR